jgi:hypothetical protein
MAASLSKETRHPQQVMQSLGITYKHATPQSMADQWWFWGCSGVPDILPPFLEVMTINPLDQVGNGLTQEAAEKILAQ